MDLLNGWKKPIPDGPILMPDYFDTKNLLEAPEYKLQPSDVILSAYPKAGQLWMQDMLYQLLHNGQFLEDINQFDQDQPWLEKNTAREIEMQPSPRIIKTHLSPGQPYLTLPFDQSCTYVYLVRNPLDTVVSYYYHCKKWLEYNELDFNYFFELFLAGEMIFGDYLLYVKRWLPFLDRENVLLVKYEDLKKNTMSELTRIAEFLVRRRIIPKWYSENDLQEIAIRSTFQNMNARGGQKEDTYHMRKGTVGDWKNHLSADQRERLVSKFIDGVKGTAAENWWPELMTEL